MYSFWKYISFRYNINFYKHISTIDKNENRNCEMKYAIKLIMLIASIRSSFINVPTFLIWHSYRQEFISKLKKGKSEL